MAKIDLKAIRREERRRAIALNTMSIVLLIMAAYTLMARTTVEWTSYGGVRVGWMEGLNVVSYHRDDRFERISVSSRFGDDEFYEIRRGTFVDGEEEKGRLLLEHARKAIRER